MNRILAGAALTIALGATAALAAPPATTQPTTPGTTSTTPSTTPTDYSARCTSLADQWKSAMTANATNKSLGKAKAKATRAAKECKSTKSGSEKRGVADYESALKMLGVTPQ